MVELKIDGWNSGYAGVENVLRRLQRKSSGYGVSSYSTVKVYGEVFAQFCRFVGKDPDQLVSLPKAEIEELIHSYLDSLIVRDLSKKTIKTWRTLLLMHFIKNGFKRAKELEIKAYTVPARYRKRSEYIPSSEEILRMADAALTVRDRAIVLCLYTSGLRHRTFLALRFKDIKADLDKDTILVPVYPEMKKIVQNTCKNNIPY
jgi:integrase